MVVAREITKNAKNSSGFCRQVMGGLVNTVEMVLVIDGLKHQIIRKLYNVEELLENPNMESNADFVEFTKQLNLSYEKSQKGHA